MRELAGGDAWAAGVQIGHRPGGFPVFDVPACCVAAMLHCMKTHLLTVQSRGTVALPADLRRRLHLDQPNAQVKLLEHEDGRVELVPVVSVPADQAWFWSERWQQLEREADADIAAGRTTTVDGLDGLLEHLSTSRR